MLALYDRRRRVWKPDELEALEAFANSATVALQNALLYQRVAQEKEKSEAIIASIADGIVVVDADSRDRDVEPRHADDDRRARRASPSAARCASCCAASSATTTTRRCRRCRRRPRPAAARSRCGWRAASARSGSRPAPPSCATPSRTAIGTVYALRDVSEDRQLDQLKSDFVATVSHELRTPLTSIYGFAETLLRGDVNFADEDRRDVPAATSRPSPSG